MSLNLDFEEIFKTRWLEAYERLLMDAVRGKLTLFVRRDEQEAAWRWVEPILSDLGSATTGQNYRRQLGPGLVERTVVA